MEPHICRENKSCACSVLADEPSENCPIHYGLQWPPRCEVCGRFMERTTTVINSEKIKEHAKGIKNEQDKRGYE